MIKELSTMALVAVVTTSVSNHFGSVLGAAQDIQAVYTKAGNVVTQPHSYDFASSVSTQTARLEKFGRQVAQINPVHDIGPFGVINTGPTVYNK